MMEKDMLWVFFIYGIRSVFCYHTAFYEYHFINTAMTRPDAQQYCRLHYDELATFTSVEDIQRVKRPSGYSYAWIGLHDDPASWRGVMGNDSNSWRWSATGTSPGGYQAWKTNEPNFMGAQNLCVRMRSGQWDDVNCKNTYHFVCFKGSVKYGSKEFLVVASPKTWSDARVHCRTHYVDLAVIEDASDLATVSNLIGAGIMWIGLSREPFRWADNRISHFKNWVTGEPDNKGTVEHCVVENSYPAHQWYDAGCEAMHRVICQQALKTRTTLVKMKLQTPADLTNPVINAHIIDKVSTMFRNLGVVDVKLSWKISPVKQIVRDGASVKC